jgi:hypothetical protein
LKNGIGQKRNSPYIAIKAGVSPAAGAIILERAMVDAALLLGSRVTLS